MTDNSISDLPHSTKPSHGFQRLLNLNQSALAAIIDHLPFSAQVYNTFGTLVAVNKKWVQLWDFEPEEMVDHFNWLNNKELIYLPPVEIFQRALAGESVQLPPIHCSIQRGDCAPVLRLLKRTCYPIGNGADRVQYIILIEDDITERMDIEKELRNAQKMEAAGSLASKITHDFNNILNAILGYTYQAKKLAAHDSVLSSKIEGISSSARRAAELVRELLQFNRQNNQKRTPTSLQPLIQEIVRHKENTLPPGIIILTNISTGCGKISCNPMQIHQAINNLLTNAHHAVQHRGGTITVTLTNVTSADKLPPSLTKDHDIIKLSVSDTGEGIPPDTIEKISQPYFTTKTFGKGVGLEMAIVHSIVTSHGGAITVESQPRQGTTFNLFFPVSTKEEGFQQPSVKGDGSTTIQPGNGKTISILFIDDERYNVQNTEAILSDAQFSVSPYTDPLKALEEFTDNPDKFDLVITDHRMPELTGLELAEKIFAIRNDIPIILITGWADIMSENTLGKYNLQKVVPKPYDSQFLINTINSLVTQNQD